MSPRSTRSAFTVPAAPCPESGGGSGRRLGSRGPSFRLGRLSLAAASLAAGFVATAGVASAGASPPAITMYSGQHVQTTQALVSAFEKKTGIKVNVRFDDEDVLAQQIAAEGGHSPADVFFTENSPPLQYLASKHLLAHLSKSDARRDPGQVQLAQRPLAGGVGPGERDGLQHGSPQAEPAAHVGHAALAVRSGRARSAWRGARPTFSRS